MRYKHIIISIFLLFSLTYVFSYIEDKLLLEKEMSSRMEEVIKKITGGKDVLVVVNIEYNPEIQQEIKSTSPNISGSQQLSNPFIGIDIFKKKSNTILPGVPEDAVVPYALQNIDIANSNINQSVPNSFISTVKRLGDIKSIKVSVILSDTVDDATVEKIKGRLLELFPLNLARGDKIDIKKEHFTKNFRWTDVLNVVGNQIRWIVALIVVIVITVFLFGPIRIFLRNLVSALEVLKARIDTRIVSQTFAFGQPGISQPPNLGEQNEPPLFERRGLGSKVSGALPSGTETTRYKHFNFVTSDNLNNLIYLLKQENPQTIALVLNYLPTEMANNVLLELDRDLRLKVVKDMMNKKIYEPQEVESIEAKIKKEIDYLLGGVDSTISLLNISDEDTRKKLFEELKTEDPSLAEELSKKILPFETLFILPKTAIQEVVRLVGARVMAAVIKSICNEEQSKYILESVSDTSRQMIEQESASTPSAIPQERLTQIKQQIISVMQNLEKRGMIKITREGAKVTKVEIA